MLWLAFGVKTILRMVSNGHSHHEVNTTNHPIDVFASEEAHFRELFAVFEVSQPKLSRIVIAPSIHAVFVVDSCSEKSTDRKVNERVWLLDSGRA